MNRREFVLGAAAVAGVSKIASASADAKKSRDKVVIVSAHPDDLVACMGFCYLVKERYEVHVVDVTHGERGLGKAGLLDGSTRAIRTKEEESVCAAIGAELHWLEEIDGEAYACRETCEKLAEIIKSLAPRAVLAHWPVDIHTDHVMAGAAAIRATFLAGLRPEFYFFEEPYQSKRFEPDIYLDVTPVADRIWETIRLYKCQYRDGGIERNQKISAEFLGKHSGRFVDGMVEGYKSFLPPMQGESTIFSELPHPAPDKARIRFQGAR